MRQNASVLLISILLAACATPEPHAPQKASTADTCEVREAPLGSSIPRRQNCSNGRNAAAAQEQLQRMQDTAARSGGSGRSPQ